MRLARDVATLDPVLAGDHVCWLVEPGEDLTPAARAFAADGVLFGDKVMVVGSPDSRWSVDGVARGLLVDPLAERSRGTAWDGPAVLGAVRREADAACREGFRTLRVLAQMDRLWPAGASPEQVARHELGLDALVADSGAIVVCAYPRDGFSPAALAQATGVHPHHLGRASRADGVDAVDGSAAGAVPVVPPPPGFRLFNAGPDRWSVSGVVDSEGAGAFHTAVSELLSSAPLVDGRPLRLSCEHLELMDTAGMRTLAAAARLLPDRRILVEQANDTVRRCWELLGFHLSQSAVELVR
ncbi:MEDS domain-containing protein [Streptacidiphilus cavernicola]|uniref:MEDS domain-containing protein n=1 Tax=Streptacidiphilus cavernicola TaxID=3342716 RepID=A0ABV6VP52_9ACTN